MKKEIKNLGLLEFFKILEYDWNEDKDLIKEICYYTKSRVNHNKHSKDFTMGYGMEQTFALKAIAESLNDTNFLEIGTGRGTGSYAVAAADNVKKVSTIDIVPHTYKKNEAIGYDPALVSNADLYQMIKSPGKEKISFYERTQYHEIMKKNTDAGYNLFFIDGNHTDFQVIAEDFLMCQMLFGDNPVIIWDDYYPDKFAIKDVVDSILERDNNFKAFLLSTRGHLFGDKKPEEGSGMIVMMKEGTYEDFFSES